MQEEVPMAVPEEEKQSRKALAAAVGLRCWLDFTVEPFVHFFVL